MTVGNRVFWGIMLFLGAHFLWLGLIEEYLPLWVGTIVGVAALVWMIAYGPRPKGETYES
ncbi:MAG: hypothetical protein GY801_26145 [bacterium]|nr:hypothetical protein [bacterium]